MTTTKSSSIRATLLGLATVTGLVACSNDSFDVPNTNLPTVEQLSGSPTKAVLGRTAVGIVASLLNPDVSGEVATWATFGREGWNLLGNDPRTTGEALRGPQDPAGIGAGQWNGKYQSIRTINIYLDAVDRAADMSDAEKSASKGFAQTIKAQLYHRAIIRNGKYGIPIHVEVGLDQPPAKFVSQDDAFAYVVALLDSARTALQAGGSAFPFNMPAGLTSFPTPPDFIRLNRGLLAKVLVHQATFTSCGNTCFTAALAALNESFLSTNLPADLSLGAYYAYSAGSGETPNPIAEPLTRDRFYVHPSYEADAQHKANGDLDDRFTSKVRVGVTKSLTQPQGTLTGTLKPVMYNFNTSTSSDPNLSAGIPWLKNEELILLRAEANIGLGNYPAAVEDLDRIRTTSGGLPAYSGPLTHDALLNELIYNRRYSLLWEQGTRWVDARRYNITNTLPIDRPGDVIFSELYVPAGECDARGLERPCDPLSAGK
jgi:hypothetical protein